MSLLSARLSRHIKFMTPSKTTTRMKSLVSQLNKASRAYYQEDREILSNLEYDRMYDELEALEAETGVQLAGSPVAKIGYEAVEGLEKVDHAVALLSLDKTKDADKLVAFLGDRAGLLSWKLDGLTVVLTYEEGVLIKAVTRGNGLVGENVTHNARIFGNIPLRIPYTGLLLVRGEAIIDYRDFEIINESITDKNAKYKNPRNLCSGSVRQLNSSTLLARSVNYYAFSILSQGDDPLSEGKKSDQLTLLKDMGFDVSKHKSVTSSSLKQDIDKFKQEITSSGIPCDGLVLTYDDIRYSVSLGATSKFPKDSLAFKWADEVSETTLLHVEWNTSRTGLINPVAIFVPVEIEGSTVNRASLHNVSIFKQLALGEGDRITVYKANMIIPQVAENLTRSGTASFPKFCAVCQGPTDVLINAEAESLYCLNPSCKAQLIASLAHFCSRDAMNIVGLSEQTLEKLAKKGFVSDYPDIFTLGRYEDEIILMEGFGKKSFDKLMDSIEQAKDINLANFIFALGIKQVGLSNAKLLCKHFGDIESLIEKSQDKDNFEKSLSVIKGFGEAIAHSLSIYFLETKNIASIRKALSFLRIKPVKIETVALMPLQDLTFVITGNVEHFYNRKALQAFIEKHGGHCTGSVSSTTSYLINNDIDSLSAKNKKARLLGIPMLTEESFLEKWKLK